MDIRRIATLKDGTDAIGNQVRVKVVKNKMARPFQVAEFTLYYGIGISREAELVDLGAARGIIKKSGAFYSYNGEQLGQGREKARLALCEQPGLADEIDLAVREKGRGRNVSVLVAAWNLMRMIRWQRSEDLMRIFYDTEFLEDGKTIDLISIGMVAEDGREYYAVVLRR